MPRFIALILLLGLFSTSGCTMTITPPTPTADLGLNPNGVIFTAAQSEDARDALGRDVTGTWTPTANDVAQLEANLPAFLGGAQNDWLRQDPPIEQREPQYMRQYLGIIEDGSQIVYANFFCSIHNDDWRTQFVFVSDGGDCYFQLKFDPSTREFFDFSVNGEA